MDLIEIDIIRAQAPQRSVDSFHDTFAREAMRVDARAHRAEDLGRDDDFVAFGEILDRAAQYFLAGPLRIDVGGVEEVDALLQRFPDEGSRGLFLQNPF